MFFIMDSNEKEYPEKFMKISNAIITILICTVNICGTGSTKQFMKRKGKLSDMIN